MNEDIKAFITWLHNPKCVFYTCYNGVDKTRPKIEYERDGRYYSLEEVYGFWKNHVLLAENQPKSHVKYLTYLCIMKLFKQLILSISILLVLLALSYGMAILLLVYVFPSIN